MDILIISEFGEDFSHSDNDRFLYLAKMLENDNNVEIITSSFRHTKKNHRRKTVESWPFRITFIEEPGYPKNICLKRFYSHFMWGKNLICYLNNRKKKPDVIYCAVPSLTGPFRVSRYCKKYNIRFVIDVQDLWPEAFQMVFNVPIVSDFIFFPFKLIANEIYKSADSICAVSETYKRRALSVNSRCEMGYSVFLGTSLKTFDDNSIRYSYKKNNNELWLAYCGTLGASYDITCVIDALEIIKKYNVIQPKFIVMGDGPRKDEFEKYAKAKKINALFVGRLPYDKMCSLLCNCDIVVNPISSGAAQSIINKHADYAASGLPVLNTQECNEYRKLINKYKMGFNCKNNDSKDLAKKLIKLIQNESLRKTMGNNSRKCAEEKFDREKTYKVLVNQIIS